MSNTGSNQSTVYVIDDAADVREGLKQLLESVGLRCEVFASPSEFFQRSPINGPSCLILDVRLPEMNGLDLQARLAKSIPIIVITGHGTIPMSVRAIQGGAVNFLTKPLSEQELLDAVYAGLRQHRAQLDQEEQLKDLRARFESLGPREREIFPLVTAGLLNKQIAAKIGMSEVTVKVHRHNMMLKLNAKNVPQLVRIADALAIRTNGSGQGA